jgi:hypothetical protein
MIMDDFVLWEDSHRKEILSVHEILSNSLQDDPESLIQQACEIEGWNGRIGSMLAESNSYLDRAKRDLRPDKDFGSEMDRRTELDGLTASVRVVRDTLESLANCIKQRLILIESLLAYHRQFIERKGKIEGGY